jgi:hypothetical protein
MKQCLSLFGVGNESKCYVSPEIIQLLQLSSLLSLALGLACTMSSLVSNNLF